MMRIFPRKSTILVTATPTLNKMSDIHGLLNQIHAFSRLNIGDQDYNPDILDEGNDFSAIRHDCDDSQDACVPLFNATATATATHADIIAVKQFAKETGKKPWSILPQFTSRMSGDADNANTTSDEI